MLRNKSGECREKMVERDKYLHLLENEILIVKKRNQNLEKQKFVLGARIEELRGQIDPAGERVAALQGRSSLFGI